MQPEILALKHAVYPSVQAALFKTAGPRGVVMAPGKIFDMQSWYHLARPLAQQGVTALSLNQSESWAVIKAVEHLSGLGLQRVSLLGGSKGGYAALKALARMKCGPVDRLAVLAPAGGDPVMNPDIRKLFISAEQDSLGFEVRTKELYEKSAQPKELKLYPGTAHSQFLFKEPFGDELRGLLLEFLS
jgi:dienelactone hydrolase